MSKIKVNEIEKASGSGITIPTGTSFTITDGLASSSLPTVPVTKGGTGLTSLGSAGQAIKVNSGGNALEFGTVAGGKILATYQDTKTDAFTTTSSSHVDITGFEINGITPASASSKFIISVSMGSVSNSTGNARAFFRIVRTVNSSDTTVIEGDASNGHETGMAFCGRNNDGAHAQCPMAFTVIDSPNTTSSVAYKVQATKGSDAGTVTVNTSNTSTGERGNTGSAIVVQEVSS